MTGEVSTTDALVQRAVGILKAGGLVAFPTETVYGLGADARNSAAVRRIFDVKGRPTSHPLITHIGHAGELVTCARELPDRALLLAERYWPGPLTLVVSKSEAVLPIVTAGLETVAVRVPNHPLALALLRAFGGPIAAPSANRFGEVSATTAEHVKRDLGHLVELILDGGTAEVGVESTIVDVTRERVRVLRLGGISVEDLESTLACSVDLELSGRSAPGQLPSHYAPRAEVVVVDALELHRCADALRARGARLAALLPAGLSSGIRDSIEVPRDPAGYARGLYDALRRLDLREPDVILVVLPEEKGIGLAVADRVQRAAAPRTGRKSALE